MEDSYRHKGMRRKLVQLLKDKGITNEAVLNAVRELPRHFFLDKAFEEWAYEDKAFPIGNEQTISQPYTVAYQSALLDIHKGDKVLEIGTGSGYQAAILYLMGAEVHSVERQEDLFRKTRELFHKIHLEKINTYYHDGTDGYRKEAPYDKILVTAAAAEIPYPLIDQLKIDGILVVPIGDSTLQQMYKIRKVSAKSIDVQKLDNFRFVPFLQGKV
ncbi:MAG: protein-L-isoaspartate(D-aspartate) O-methyltransferase [Saprospiraceae bacterium]